MKERSELLRWIRAEVVGPAKASGKCLVEFKEKQCYLVKNHRGPIGWRPNPESDVQEILFFDKESPNRKYGCGLLHPQWVGESRVEEAEVANRQSDKLGFDVQSLDSGNVSELDSKHDQSSDIDQSDTSDDFEVTNSDLRRPSTIGLSVCVRVGVEGKVVVTLPRTRRFTWQSDDDEQLQLNGLYESCLVYLDGESQSRPGWRRCPGVSEQSSVEFLSNMFEDGKVLQKEVPLPSQSSIHLVIEIFPRKTKSPGLWLVTVVLRNQSPQMSTRNAHELTLYQTHMEITVVAGQISPYPESTRSFAELDADEQSLALLYGESVIWGIGHGCAAGWETDQNNVPTSVFSDVMPVVQLPSMTPDVTDSNGQSIRMSMRELAVLPDELGGDIWSSLDRLVLEYERWIESKQRATTSLDDDLRAVGNRHMAECADILKRMRGGVSLLKSDPNARASFRLANLAMLLQQISTKVLVTRPLAYVSATQSLTPMGTAKSPWDIYTANGEPATIGQWRAFQIGFLLMSIDGLSNGNSQDHDKVDLIWFPTGGGKTEAYLGAMAFYIFYQRLNMAKSTPGLPADGTNVLMRYTLRMLTTQQFQRASSLVCAMEFLRRNPKLHVHGSIAGGRFSLGLWIGGDGSPNKIDDAKTKVNLYRKGELVGNPLVLTECPWCRSAIGRYGGPTPAGAREAIFGKLRTVGITEIGTEGPLLHCSDAACEFGHSNHLTWLPVEVIDERIFRFPPSLVISTADKFAMIAFKPAAGALFGRERIADQVEQVRLPPGLIIQDELHLISGPLGTMYSLYEGVIEHLCTADLNGVRTKPKIIASTATIRGASSQVLSLYGRSDLALFPSPGLTMGDSFFGRYERDKNGKLHDGRLYLGILASEYGSILTAQVRAFSSALFGPYTLEPKSRDPWWTLIAFYNSLRELGGAKTLFDSDIRSRLKFMFNREGYTSEDRRQLRIVEELTSRVTQSEVVEMMDRLSLPYKVGPNSRTLDACLASNIIEVGVDIDRLSLMAVVGQPKTTSTYIQVTGRVGRRWLDRPGLIIMLYNPSKNRDRSHFEQFHGYHRRLYERVEPTSATPFATAAIHRGLSGVLIAFARQYSNSNVQDVESYRAAVNQAAAILEARCRVVQDPSDVHRSLKELELVRDALMKKWDSNPQFWERFPPIADEEYLMLWPGQYASVAQKQRGVVVPSSMRQVDGNAVLRIQETDE